MFFIKLPLQFCRLLFRNDRVDIMKKALVYSMVLVSCICMLSCKTTVSTGTDKSESLVCGGGDLNIMGVYHGIESYASSPYVFIGEFTGTITKKIDGNYCKEFHVTEKIRGDVEDYILIYHADGYGITFPFKTGEKYLLMTDIVDTIYWGKYYNQGSLFCPIDSFKDSYMIVLGEKKSLDFMTTGSKDNFKDYDSFKAYLTSLIETTDAKGQDWPYYTDSDDIYDILTAAPQILKVKIIDQGSKDKLYSDYLCRVEKVYKGDYDPERGSLARVGFSGETTIIRPANQRKHYFEFRIFDDDIDLEKTDEYIICTNSFYLIARKGVISLDYTEEEIIDMLREIYGEVNIMEIPEENAELK